MKKARKALCILMVILIGLLHAAAAEDGADQTAPVTGDPIGTAGTAEVTNVQADDPANEQQTVPMPDVTEDPAEELPPSEHDDPEEEQTGEPAEESPAAENAGAAGEMAVQWDGTLRVGIACEVSLRDRKLYCLTLTQMSDLLLEVSGVPVKVTVTALHGAWTRAWQSEAAEEPGLFLIRETMSLKKGEYSVAVEPLQDGRQGSVTLRFSDAVGYDAGTPLESGEAQNAAAESTAETQSEIDPHAVTETAEAADEIPETADAVPADSVSEEAGEENPAGFMSGEAEETFTDSAPAEPLIVRVTVSCGESIQPGATVVLTAVVSDPDYQGTIRWQYSADGGETVCELEGVEGAEYAFTLNEENLTYWWRAYID